MIRGEQKEYYVAWRELATRSRPASFVYIIAAPVVMSVSPKMAAAPIIPELFLVCFLILTWLRAANASLVARTPGQVPHRMTAKFVRLAHTNGALWGLFSAYGVSVNEGWRMFFVLFISGIICAGAISSMTPNFRVFLGFSAATFLPANLVLLLSQNERSLMIGSLIFGLWGLSIWMGWTQNRNYWTQLLTNRRQMEELRSARERLELVVSGSNLGAFDWVLDEGKIYLDSKVADVLGYPHTMFDPFTEQLGELMSPQDIDPLKALVLNHLKDPGAPLCEIEVRLLDATGGEHWFNFRGRVVQRDALARATRMSGTYEDITRRKQTEAALDDLQRRVEQAEKLKTLGVLAGGVAHDFNNLLAAFVGNLELAELDIPGESPAREHLEQAKHSALDASDLCNQLLAYAGKGRFVIEKFCMNALVEEMVQLLRVSVGRNLELRVSLSANLPWLEGDASQIRQVLLNLLTNASESMEGKTGVIWLTTYVVPVSEIEQAQPNLQPLEHVCLEVRDEGCGMARETLDKIFDPFFTTKFTGRGLGLASVIGIARGHGGEILAESALGEGTSFRLLLPALEAPVELTKVAPSSPPSKVSSAKILVVDDEEAIRRVTKHMLVRAGHDVVIAEDGVVALEQLRRHDGDISLVLLDLTMPRKDGYETLHEIRQTWPDMPVLLSSGYSEDAVIEDQIPAQGFLKKPFTRNQLLTEVSKAQA